MKSILLFSALVAWANPLQAYCQNQSALFYKVDFVPIQQMAPLSEERYQLQFGSYDNQLAKPVSTLVVRPHGKQHGQDLVLPLGVDVRTVTVTSGELPLRLENDYVFLPNINRLRIVKEAILRSDQPLIITYERPDFTR